MHRTLLGGAFGLVAACALTGAASAQDPLTLEDLFEIRSVGAIALSPDGDQVAYTLSVPRNVIAGDEDGTGDVELHIASRVNTTRGFITGEGRLGSIAWRPDGGAVTFLASRSGDSGTTLYEIAVDGGEAQRVYSHVASIQSYAITPDGETLYFVARDEADETASSLRSRGFRANVYEENGVFSYVWRVDLTDEDAEAERFDLPGHASGLTLSDDGSRLGVILAPTTLVDDSLMERDWHIVDGATGDVVARIDTPGKIGGAAFSPDGRRFSFLAAADRADPTAGTLHVADAGTGAYEAIARDAEQHVSQITWRDRDTIIALTSVGTGTAQVEYNVSGREERRIAHEGFVAASMDFDRETGRLAAVAHSATHPRELYVRGRGGLQRWTDHNPQLAGTAWGEQSVFSFSARDGERIEGVLVTPQGEAPAGGWPLIMTVHGGPEAHDQNG
jgi:dipeptidyl aminopeptidase/acylaminoacyl peptidase